MPDFFDPFIAQPEHAALRNADSQQVMSEGNTYWRSRERTAANKHRIATTYACPTTGDLHGKVLDDNSTLSPTQDDCGNTVLYTVKCKGTISANGFFVSPYLLIRPPTTTIFYWNDVPCSVYLIKKRNTWRSSPLLFVSLFVYSGITRYGKLTTAGIVEKGVLQFRPIDGIPSLYMQVMGLANGLYAHWSAPFPYLFPGDPFVFDQQPTWDFDGINLCGKIQLSSLSTRTVDGRKFGFLDAMSLEFADGFDAIGDDPDIIDDFDPLGFPRPGGLPYASAFGYWTSSVPLDTTKYERVT